MFFLNFALIKYSISSREAPNLYKAPTSFFKDSENVILFYPVVRNQGSLALNLLLIVECFLFCSIEFGFGAKPYDKYKKLPYKAIMNSS
jgi:hypothetical protein